MTELSLVQNYLVAMVVELLRLQMDLQSLQEKEEEKKEKEKDEKEKDEKANQKRKKALFIDKKIAAIETWMKQSAARQKEEETSKMKQKNKEKSEKGQSINEKSEKSVEKANAEKQIYNLDCTIPLESLLLQDLTSIYNIAILTLRLASAIAFVGKKIVAHNNNGLLDGLLKTHQHVADQAWQSKKSAELTRMLAAMT